MTWNHRVVKFTENGEDWYAVCEVYYNDDGTIYAHTQDGIRVTGESVEELKETLERMLRCVDQKVVEAMK